jgi:hypothetical protein
MAAGRSKVSVFLCQWCVISTAGSDYDLTDRRATGSSTLTVTSRRSETGPVDPGLTSSTLVGHNWTSRDLQLGL